MLRIFTGVLDWGVEGGVVSRGLERNRLEATDEQDLSQSPNNGCYGARLQSRNLPPPTTTVQLLYCSTFLFVLFLYDIRLYFVMCDGTEHMVTSYLLVK